MSLLLVHYLLAIVVSVFLFTALSPTLWPHSGIRRLEQTVLFILLLGAGGEIFHSPAAKHPLLMTGDSLLLLLVGGTWLLAVSWPASIVFLRRAHIFLAAVMLSLGLTECVLANSGARSDVIDFTLASHDWFERYWNPINSLSYRDRNHFPGTLTGKKLMLVVGDSFVAGHGIDRIEDRFSDQLQAHLGERWVVANVAQCGWDTSDERKAIALYPANPDVVILSYYINDIEQTCVAAGFPMPELIGAPPDWLRRIVDRSRLANLIYWRMFRGRHGRDVSLRYKTYLESCFRQPDAWARHTTDIRALVSAVRARHSRLLVVIFPSLIDIAGTEPQTAQVATVFKEEQVPVLNLSDVLAGRNPAKLVVSTWDSHPNVALHHEIAELLRGRLVELRWVDAS